MKSILIVGESCRDIFVYCNATRLCPEAPVPVLNVVEQKENPGMAANVRRNIESIYGSVDIHTNPNWHDITKTRYVHLQTNHMFFRVDSLNAVERIDVTKLNLNYDFIIISDYNKGFLTEDDIEYICLYHRNVFIDTKKILGPWVRNARFIKINDYEYKNSLPYITDDFASKIIHTMGDQGCEYQGRIYPTTKVEVKDASGAGDTFMAAFVVNYAETDDIDSSLNYANMCASKVVSQRGVTTA